MREADADPTGHAEVVALRAAARDRGEWRLDGCTLVVTLEPCTMCAGAAVLSRVDRVVFGACDPKAGAVGSLWDVVRDRRLNHRPEVVAGVLAEESAALLEEFFAAASLPDAVERTRLVDRFHRRGSGNLLGGGVSERPKEHASKGCVGQPTVGSNPTATASQRSRQDMRPGGISAVSPRLRARPAPRSAPACARSRW